VIVQMLAAIPLALWAASIIHVSAPPRRQKAALLWACVAVAAAAAAIACGTAISEAFRQSSPTVRAIVRPVFCTFLLIPWCAAARTFGGSASYQTPNASMKVVLPLLCIVIAVGPPILYLGQRIPEISRRAEQLTERRRYWQAWQTTNLLRELGSESRVFGQS